MVVSSKLLLSAVAARNALLVLRRRCDLVLGDMVAIVVVGDMVPFLLPLAVPRIGQKLDRCPAQAALGNNLVAHGNASMSPQTEFGNAVASRPATVTIGYTFDVAACPGGDDTGSAIRLQLLANVM